MTTLFPGELQHFEGTDALCNAKQEAREIFYTTDSGTLRYKTSGGDLVLFALYSPNVVFTPEGGLAIKLINNTGSPSVVGQIVTPSGTLGFRTVSVNDDMPIGVVYNSVANGSACWVVVAGMTNILVDAGGCTFRYVLYCDATAGSATASATIPAATNHFREVGHCLESRVGAGLCKAVLHFN